MIDLAGRAALVSGGSRGVGAATALLLARAGADVAITFRTRKAEAEAVAGRIRELGRRALVSPGEASDPAAARETIAAVRDAFGKLDIVVASAGTWPAAETRLRDMTPARWRDTLATNLDGVFVLLRAALQLMDEGAVVLVSSTAGQRGEAMHADYAAAKGAVISLTKSLALECAPRITVNCVAPGWIDTEMSAPALGGGGRERIADAIPLQRIATADDVAGPIVFLCSPLARHITGEVLNVNGGSVLCG
jgi:3-oxoacyl-[acyl-carrier protein] reductase